MSSCGCHQALPILAQVLRVLECAPVLCAGLGRLRHLCVKLVDLLDQVGLACHHARVPPLELLLLEAIQEVSLEQLTVGRDRDLDTPALGDAYEVLAGGALLLILRIVRHVDSEYTYFLKSFCNRESQHVCDAVRQVRPPARAGVGKRLRDGLQRIGYAHRYVVVVLVHVHRHGHRPQRVDVIARALLIGLVHVPAVDLKPARPARNEHVELIQAPYFPRRVTERRLFEAVREAQDRDLLPGVQQRPARVSRLELRHALDVVALRLRIWQHGRRRGWFLRLHRVDSPLQLSLLHVCQIPLRIPPFAS
ncbi:MAG: hypothetical protein WC651_03185 [Candidatus Gracilibacteria bacterium]